MLGVDLELAEAHPVAGVRRDAGGHAPARAETTASCGDSSSDVVRRAATRPAPSAGRDATDASWKSVRRRRLRSEAKPSGAQRLLDGGPALHLDDRRLLERGRRTPRTRHAASAQPMPGSAHRERRVGPAAQPAAVRGEARSSQSPSGSVRRCRATARAMCSSTSRGATRARTDGRGGTGLPVTTSASAIADRAVSVAARSTSAPSPHAVQTPRTSVSPDRPASRFAAHDPLAHDVRPEAVTDVRVPGAWASDASGTPGILG